MLQLQANSSFPNITLNNSVEISADCILIYIIKHIDFIEIFILRNVPILYLMIHFDENRYIFISGSHKYTKELNCSDTNRK
jgi:hypothetical protein